MAQIKYKDQGKVKIHEILEDSLYVGSSNENHVRIHDPNVAGIHLEIKKTRDGYKLIDLESKSGTRVNGEFVNHHLLEDGDRIRIGDTPMKFEQEQVVRFEAGSTRSRLQRERGIFDNVPTGGVVTIVLGGALLIFAILFVILRTGGPTAAQKQAMRAKDLADQGEFEQALGIIEEARREYSVDPAIERMFRDIEERIESDRESEEVLDENEGLYDSMMQVIAYAKEHGDDLANREEILRRFDDWTKNHPDAPKHLVENLANNRAIIEKNFEVLEKRKKRRDNW